MVSDNHPERPSPVPKRWVLLTAAGVGLAWIACLLVGVYLTAGGGQSPIDSYLLTIFLSALSIAAGWIGTALADQIKNGKRQLKELQKQNLIDSSAESAVQRLFSSLASLGRIEEIASEPKEGAPARLRTIKELV